MSILSEDGIRQIPGRKTLRIYKKCGETGGMKNEEVNLYNKYAYDYLYTREGEERGGKQGEEMRKRFRGKSLRRVLEC